MYIKYVFNQWWKYHYATLTWKISQHFESFVVAIIIGQLLQNICITDDHDMFLFSWTQYRPSTLFFTCLRISTGANVSKMTLEHE
jgi:hypothetical protein